MTQRAQPNIAIAGTPGVGKSRLCTSLLAHPSLSTHTLLDITALSKTHNCRLDYDERLSTWVIDETKLAKKLTPQLISPGGCIIDYMHAAIWPRRAPVDLVVVVRCQDTAVLWDRYKERGYKQEKIEENLDAEIMGEIEGESREWFGIEEDEEEEGEEASAAWWTCEMKDQEEEKANVGRIVKWVEKWREERERVGEEEMGIVPFEVDDEEAAADDETDDSHEANGNDGSDEFEGFSDEDE